MASQGWQYSLIRPSTLQVRLYLSELVGKAGSAPTRIFTSCTLSNCLARWWATMPMKPGASPHCGMKAVLAPFGQLHDGAGGGHVLGEVKVMAAGHSKW
jgi:hypothetical protein